MQPLHPQPPKRAPRGFTLIEMAVILVIIGILASLAMAGLEQMKTRAAFTSNAGDIVTGLRKTQAAAAGDGNYTAFIVDTQSKQWWGIQTTSAFTLAGFNPAAPGTVIASGQLDRNVSFPAAGYGQALPAPFAAVPTNSPCTFCDVAAHRGSLLFAPSGSISFSVDPGGVAQQFTLQGQVGQTTRTIAVAVVGRTGLIESFER